MFYLSPPLFLFFFISSSPSLQYLHCSPLSFSLFHILIRSHITASTIVTRHQLKPGTNQCIVIQCLQKQRRHSYDFLSHLSHTSLTYRIVHPQSHPLLRVVKCSHTPEHFRQEGCRPLNEQCQDHHWPLRSVRGKLLRLTHGATSSIVPCTGDIVGKVVQVDLEGNATSI